MKTLKVSELKENNIYWCNLSERKVLITRLENKTTTINGKEIDYIECDAWAYFKEGGSYVAVVVWDNMLSHLNDYV